MSKISYQIFKFPTKLVFRPFRHYLEIKDQGAGNVAVAIGIIIVLSILSSLSYNATGFLVNDNNGSKYNGVLEFLGVFSPILLLTISNWSVTVLFNGKGTYREIVMVAGYSLFPYLVMSFIALIFSNIMIASEIYIYYLIINIGLFFTCLNILAGIVIIHEYSLREALLTIIFTIMAFIVILFLLFLMFSLLLQIYDFIVTFERELIMRLGGV